ncbi:hypothetical protein DFA_05782 [Cavenderia fasciculata]|uniref:Uncharacterized protein n=1 Tax=Cavenderia fasciculata TaxID=261658 RepID=F4PMK1_CACFS|nr:uncharacterized protein DFA_05782 [Cavenderia fasciculata]EGG23648.1 hypothetical protein DFA_05782 [Cavenderia fasciculata]|eukprot:XP_004361499.1 hypothetical protein DFA_05782 [Cavenderia fasciculata]
MNPLIIIFILCILVSSVFANLSCNNQYVFVNDTNSLPSSFSLFDHVEQQQSNINQNKNISLSMMMQPLSVSLSSFDHFEHPIILNKNKNNKNNIINNNNNNDIHSSISQTQFDSNHIFSQFLLTSNHTFIPVYNNKNNNNLSFNSSISIPLSQSHFQLPLNHSTNNHIIFYDDKEEEEEEEYVQLNSNSSNTTISCFNHVEHQFISINYPLPISSFPSFSHNIHFNSSHVLFISNHSTTKNHIILEEEDFNNSPISISCFNVIHQSNLILEDEEEEEFVQLNNSSKSTHSLTCLDNVKHQSIPINNQSNNNNYFSLIHSSSLISPIPFSNTSTSSSSSSTLYLLSNTINSTRSKTSPFSRYSSNISRIENNNADTNNYFDSLNCFGTNHSNNTTIQRQSSSSPINHDTILNTIHIQKSTPPSSNNNNNNNIKNNTNESASLIHSLNIRGGAEGGVISIEHQQQQQQHNNNLIVQPC